MTFEEVMKKLKAASNPNQKDLEGMKRYGINIENTLCISMPTLDKISRLIKNESKENRHQIAEKLWKTGIREARILAARIDVPEFVTSKQMESWVLDFNSWDVCDNTVMKLFHIVLSGLKKLLPGQRGTKSTSSAQVLY